MSNLNSGRKMPLFVVFIILYVSNDTLLFGTNKNQIFFYLQMAILASLLVVMLFMEHYVSRNQIIILLILTGFSLVSMIINLDINIKYFYEIFVFVLSLLIVSSIDVDSFLIAYQKILYVLDIASIILFLLFEFSYGNVLKFPYILNDSDLKYFYFGLGFLEDLPHSVIPRSYGIFREPGVYFVFLTLAIVFELFYFEGKSKKRLLVYFIALMLTFSTAAYIIMALIIPAYVFDLFRKKNVIIKNFSFLIPLVLVGFLFISYFGWDNISKVVFGKLGTSNSSVDSRFGSVITDINMASENLITGKGWTFVEKEFNNFSMSAGYGELHNTNTLLKMLALHGTFYFVLVLFLIHKFWYTISSSVGFAAILTIIYIVALSNEDLCVNPMVYILMFYGTSDCRRKDEDSDNKFSPIRQHG